MGCFMQPKMGGPNEDQILTQSPENWDSFRVFNESSVGPPSGRSWLSDLDWGVVMFLERWFTRLH